MGKRKTREERLRDVYEAEDSEPEEDKRTNQRYDTVDNFQYELPEDFEDEEIDEEAAFTADDAQLAQMFSGGDGGEDAEEAGEEEGAAGGPLTRDDFSEDDSEADELYGKPGARQQRRVGQAKRQPADAEMDEIFGGVSDPDSEEEAASEGEDPNAADRAKNAVRAALGSGARKQARKAALLDEAMPESEYNVSLGAGPAGELSLGDLLRGLKPAAGKMSAQQKQLAKLARSGQAVDPSLPGPIRARKERQAGYEATRADVSKWTPIVRANREAATLVLTAPKNDVPKTSTTAALGAKFQPQEGGMEAEVAALLRAAGVQSERAVEAAEEALALKAVSSEEVHARRAELARMRSLLFRHEAKAKHLAKIKSKDYHRRLKKAARRKAEAAGEGEGDREFIRLEAERAEFERAKERLTLKHKNTSQWARRALRRGLDAQDAGTREAIEEQLRLGQALRRKVDSMGAAQQSGSEASTEAESDSGSESDATGSGGEGEGPHARGGMGRRAAAKAKAAADAILEGGEAEGVSKGLFSLPFMRRAQEARKRQAEAAARDMLAELEGRPAGGEAVQPTQGRRNFGLADGVQANDAPPDFEVEGDSDASGPDEDAEARRERLRAAAASEPPADAPPAATAAPAAARRKGVKRSKQAAASAGAAEVASWEPGQAPAWEQPEQPQQQQQQQQQEAQLDAVEAALGGGVLARVRAQQASLAGRAHLLAGDGPGSTSGPKRKRGAGSVRVGTAAAAAADAEASQGGGEAEREPETAGAAAAEAAQAAAQQRGSLSAEGAVVAVPAEGDSDGEGGPEQDAGGLSQRELIAAAFAGDDVAAEFAAEKEAEVEGELPGFEAPSLLPGWGAWAAQQREPKWMAAARAKAERQKQGARAGRKDARLEGVVISEKWDKKAAKFSAPQLPYPFTSQQALEAAMRQPLGLQFNTHASFRALTRPAVIKGTGVIIQPLKYSQPVAEAARQAHSTSNASRPAVRRVSGGMAQPTKKRRAA